MEGRNSTSRSQSVQVKGNGFTLIELLIVIAIILILISIALPNFLEAQNRARVTRAWGDQRALKTALASYRNDYKDFPIGWQKNFDPLQTKPVNAWKLSFPTGLFVKWRLTCLTTPVKYMTALPESVFGIDCYKHSGGCDKIIGPNGQYNPGSEYNQDGPWYDHPNTISAGARGKHQGNPRYWYGTQYHLRDPGPDGIWSNSTQQGQTVIAPYTPTNGTKSFGDIWTFGP
jgi:prepilin-type N-terminal cleavage/methylation domain-containing protein